MDELERFAEHVANLNFSPIAELSLILNLPDYGNPDGDTFDANDVRSELKDLITAKCKYPLAIHATKWFTDANTIRLLVEIPSPENHPYHCLNILVYLKQGDYSVEVASSKMTHQDDKSSPRTMANPSIVNAAISIISLTKMSQEVTWKINRISADDNEVNELMALFTTWGYSCSKTDNDFKYSFIAKRDKCKITVLFTHVVNGVYEIILT